MRIIYQSGVWKKMASPSPPAPPPILPFEHLRTPLDLFWSSSKKHNVREQGSINGPKPRSPNYRSGFPCKCPLHPTQAIYAIYHRLISWYLHQGSLWGGTGISLCFLLFRLFVRLKAFRRLYSDDFIVIAAWTIKLVVNILWQMKAPVLYEHFDVMAGKKLPDVGFVNRDTALQRTVVLFSILFYSALWLVKLSFLMFFRRLGSKVKGQKIWWWFILVFTLLTWVACIADIEYKCSFNSYAFIICEFSPSCSGTHKSTNAERRFADGRAREKHIVGLWSQYVTKAACSMLTPWRTWLPTASVSLGRLHFAAPCTI